MKAFPFTGNGVGRAAAALCLAGSCLMTGCGPSDAQRLELRSLLSETEDLEERADDLRMHRSLLTSQLERDSVGVSEARRDALRESAETMRADLQRMERILAAAKTSNETAQRELERLSTPSSK